MHPRVFLLKALLCALPVCLLAGPALAGRYVYVLTNTRIPYEACMRRCDRSDTLGNLTRNGCVKACDEMRRTFSLRAKKYEHLGDCVEAYARLELERDEIIEENQQWCIDEWKHIHKRQGCKDAVTAFYNAATPENMCGARSGALNAPVLEQTPIIDPPARPANPALEPMLRSGPKPQSAPPAGYASVPAYSQGAVAAHSPAPAREAAYAPPPMLMDTPKVQSSAATSSQKPSAYAPRPVTSPAYRVPKTKRPAGQAQTQLKSNPKQARTQPPQSAKPAARAAAPAKPTVAVPARTPAPKQNALTPATAPTAPGASEAHSAATPGTPSEGVSGVISGAARHTLEAAPVPAVRPTIPSSVPTPLPVAAPEPRPASVPVAAPQSAPVATPESAPAAPQPVPVAPDLPLQPVAVEKPAATPTAAPAGALRPETPEQSPPAMRTGQPTVVESPIVEPQAAATSVTPPAEAHPTPGLPQSDGPPPTEQPAAFQVRIPDAPADSGTRASLPPVEAAPSTPTPTAYIPPAAVMPDTPSMLRRDVPLPPTLPGR